MYFSIHMNKKCMFSFVLNVFFIIDILIDAYNWISIIQNKQHSIKFYTIHFFLSKESKTVYFLNIKYLEEKNMMINKINKILILIIFISYCYTKNK